MIYTFIIGLIFLIPGLKLLKDRISFIKNGHSATATVVEIEEKEIEVEDGSERKTETVYRQVFQYSTHNNEEIKFILPDSPFDKVRAVGDEVTIVYDKREPNNKIVLTQLNTFGMPLLVITIALVLLFISGTYFLSLCFFNSL